MEYTVACWKLCGISTLSPSFDVKETVLYMYSIWNWMKLGTVSALTSPADQQRNRLTQTAPPPQPPPHPHPPPTPGQNGRHFADDIFVNEKFCILIRISPKSVPKGPVDNNQALVSMMSWRRMGDKPLSEPLLIRRIYPALGGHDIERDVGISWKTFWRA